MARTHATVYASAWSTDSGFRDLPYGAQWLYIALLAQPDVSLVGIKPYLPQRWVRFAPDVDLATIERHVVDLEERGYIVIDEDTVEMWFRTFMYHDGVFKQGQVVKAAANAYDAVLSPRLRDLIVQSVPPQLREGWPDNVQSLKRDEVTALLKQCDAAQWKPTLTPNARVIQHPNGRVMSQ